MNKPDFQYWDSLYYHDGGRTADRPFVGSYVDLTLTYRASCHLTPDGKIDLVTRTGGGTDSGCGLGAIPFHQLRALIEEAQMVGRYYFGNNWGLNQEEAP